MKTLHLPQSLISGPELRLLSVNLTVVSVAHPGLVPDQSLSPVKFWLRGGGGSKPLNPQRIIGLPGVARPPQLLSLRLPET